MIFIEKINAMTPLNDYIFKRIFGRVGNESITKNFINSILDDKIESVNLEGNTILEKDLLDDKIGILDIKAKLDNEIMCDIEMQVLNHKDIDKRIMFYWSKLYSSSIKSGQNYNSLKKTISILIANFEIDNLIPIPKGHTEWKIREKKFPQIVLTNVFELHIIELPKIRRQLKKMNLVEEEKELLKWIKFLINPKGLGESEMGENEALKKAKEEFDNIQNDEYEQRMAELRMKHIMDTKAIEEYGYDKGLEDGIKQGKEEGIRQGKEEGIRQGLEQGKIQIVKKLLEKGRSIEEIMELTDLKREDIEKIH